MPVSCLFWALVCLWCALSLNDDTRSPKGGCCRLVDYSPMTAAVCLFTRRRWDATDQGRTDVRWAYAASTSHRNVLFWLNICQKTDLHSSPLSLILKQSGSFLLLIDVGICGTSDVAATDRSNPSCPNTSHWEAAPLSSWKSLETGEDGNQAPANPALKHTQDVVRSSFLGRKTSSVQTSGVYDMLPSWRLFKHIIEEMKAELVCQS